MNAFTIILAAFFSACGAAILTWLILAIKWIVKKIKADSMTVDALAHDAYFKDCRYLLNKEIIPIDEYENHEILYKAYKAQGLNGTGDKLHKVISEKKITTDSIDTLI